ncbi:MAG: phosphodiester glycosidase family protein [Candidatus Uhrbacteria bacterium]|nr:phosphodiester glycosidase family protein [Candidatus Uhrbacteria bacterium]
MQFPFLRTLVTLCLCATLLIPSEAGAQATPDSLLTLACPAGSTNDHPCRAVYYFGSDGKRHAFPHEKVYFTWYAGFSGVRTVSGAFLTSLPLGSNVTYRPGVRMVKFTTDPNVYAVALGGELRWVKTEALAIAFYGENWNQRIDDISDAFYVNYHFGPDIVTEQDFDPATEQSATVSIDDDLPATHRSLTVSAATGSFSVELVKLQRKRYRMITETAEGRDCGSNCAAISLRDYVTATQADAGIHGSYSCPPDYADCVEKINTFLSPFFDTTAGAMINQSGMAVHKGPMLTYSPEGLYRFFHRTRDVTGAMEAAASNYPSLVENGTVIVQSEERLEDEMRTTKGVRGAIGIDDHFVYLVIARQATVPDVAEIMKTLGSTHALNLDGGGSAALWFEGSYAFGPGRLLPNAILFKQK